MKTPAKRKQLWEEEDRNGGKIFKESKYYFHYCLTSIYLLEISACSRNHGTRQNPCPGNQIKDPRVLMCRNSLP